MGLVGDFNSPIATRILETAREVRGLGGRYGIDSDVSDLRVQCVSGYRIRNALMPIIPCRLTDLDHHKHGWGQRKVSKEAWGYNHIKNARSIATARHVALTVASSLGSGIVDRVTTPAL